MLRNKTCFGYQKVFQDARHVYHLTFIFYESTKQSNFKEIRLQTTSAPFRADGFTFTRVTLIIYTIQNHILFHLQKESIYI